MRFLICLLLLAGAARAGDYLVIGNELAGRATVVEGAKGKARVHLSWRTFGGGGKPGAIDGDGTVDARHALVSFQGVNLSQAKVAGRAARWIPTRSAQGFSVLVIPGLSTNLWNEVG